MEYLRKKTVHTGFEDEYYFITSAISNHQENYTDITKTHRYSPTLLNLIEASKRYEK